MQSRTENPPYDRVLSTGQVGGNVDVSGLGLSASDQKVTGLNPVVHGVISALTP